MIILTPALNMKIFLLLNMTIRMPDQNLLVTMICNNYLSFCEINEVLTFHLYKSKHTYVWPMYYLSVILLFPAKKRFVPSTGIMGVLLSHTIVWPRTYISKPKLTFFFYFVCYFFVWVLQCVCVSYTWDKYLGSKRVCREVTDQLFIV